MRTSGLVLLACAGLLLSGGAVLGWSTAWSVMRMSYYFWTTDLGVELGSAALFVAGSLLCLPACWLATLVPYHPRSLSLIATLMFLVTAAMLLLSTGISTMTALSRALREPEMLNASMLHAMSRQPIDPPVRSAFSAMQLELKCCGITSHTDWFRYRSKNLPSSCCNRIWNEKRLMQCETPVHKTGCLRPALLELRYFTNTVTVLSSVLIFILAATLFAAAYTLVNGVLERSDSRPLKPQPLRIACLHAPPLMPFSSPVVVPTQPQNM